MELGLVLQHLRPKANWAISGDVYEGLDWRDSDQPPTKDECKAAWEVIKHEVGLRPIREERRRLLFMSDWTQVTDAPVDSKAWATYRQKLRDLPATIEDPTATIVWPTPPA